MERIREKKKEYKKKRKIYTINFEKKRNIRVEVARYQHI